MSEPLHDLSCAIHVHSTCSDGTATVPEIVEAARESGRDVVVLTDHDTMRARELGHEGWHGAVLLLVGEEVSPRPRPAGKMGGHVDTQSGPGRAPARGDATYKSVDRQVAMEKRLTMWRGSYRRRSGGTCAPTGRSAG